MTPEQLDGVYFQIGEICTQQYMSAYLSGLGANIHMGDKQARKRARQAGVLAMSKAESDFKADFEHYEVVRQERFSDFLAVLEKRAIEEQSRVLVPENGSQSGKIVLPN